VAGRPLPCGRAPDGRRTFRPHPGGEQNRTRKREGGLDRTAYLRRCALVSLRKRAGGLLLLAALAAGLAGMLGLPPLGWVLAGLLALGAAGLWVALSSVRRHADDPEAGRRGLPSDR